MSAAEPIIESGVPATLATMVLPLRSTIGRDAFTSTPLSIMASAFSVMLFS